MIILQNLKKSEKYENFVKISENEIECNVMWDVLLKNKFLLQKHNFSFMMDENDEWPSIDQFIWSLNLVLLG